MAYMSGFQKKKKECHIPNCMVAGNVTVQSNDTVQRRRSVYSRKNYFTKTGKMVSKPLRRTRLERIIKV